MPIISWPTSITQSRAFQASLSQLVQLKRIPKDFAIMPNPLPVYSVGPRDLINSTDANVAAKLVSWRYFANGSSPNSVIAGDVSLSLPPRITSLSYGNQVWNSLQVAEATHPDVPKMDTSLYEPRLLRVPPLYVEAYWMKSLSPSSPGEETGWIIPYHMDQPPDSPDLARMYPMKAFSDQLLRLALTQLNKPDAPHLVQPPAK
jgi:hypothetical protein